MPYFVKEIFYTLQGEGFHAGRAAVFLRFAGCNLWSGREEDRASAVCRFCDTDFLGGARFSDADELARTVENFWPDKLSDKKFVVCTGGEPLLQLDNALLRALHDYGFLVAIETNGTTDVPPNVDWVCVSPKQEVSILKVRCGDEIKFVYPQELSPSQYESLSFDHFFIQPKDGPDSRENTAKAIGFVASRPKWRLSLQTHKLVGLR